MLLKDMMTSARNRRRKNTVIPINNDVVVSEGIEEKPEDHINQKLLWMRPLPSDMNSTLVYPCLSEPVTQSTRWTTRKQVLEIRTKNMTDK